MFEVILVELTNTVFVNSTNLSTNIEQKVLSKANAKLHQFMIYQFSDDIRTISPYAITSPQCVLQTIHVQVCVLSDEYLDTMYRQKSSHQTAGG